MRVTIVVACILFFYYPLNTFAQKKAFDKEDIYQHGVASGDPGQHSVLIWTRLSGDNGSAITGLVNWEVASDSFFTKKVAGGKARTSANSDGTIQIEVKKLEPDKYYFYRFKYKGIFSQIGRTKTLPLQAKQVKLAVVSCSNFEAGYFNAYRSIAEINGIDAVVHLGDYIYEYEPAAYGDSSLPRRHLPAKEIITLSDYRGRYAQYRKDPDLQELHRLHPFIVVWDDHEVANNNWREGAQNHQSEQEGKFEDRRKAALQAYFEWLPICQLNDTIYRSFQFGDLATLWMLDGRQYRDLQPALGDDSLRFLTHRTLLGEAQFDWLTNGIRNSKATWNILGNDVMMSSVDYGKLLPEGTDFYLDMWEGYPAERGRIMEAMKETGKHNFIVLTGDIHCSWGFELTPDAKSEAYRNNGSSNSLGAEWVTPSITSKNFGEYINDGARTKLFEQLLKGSNAHLKYVDLLAHGYLMITLNDHEAKADWFNIKSIKDSGESAVLHVQSQKLEKGSGQLKILPLDAEIKQ